MPRFLTEASSSNSSVSSQKPGCACSSSSSSSASSWCPPKKCCSNNNQSFSFPICYGPIIFTSMITPLNNMVTVNGQSTVKFMMDRNGKTITLQWEPFSGTLGANGISHLDVLQGITNLPQNNATGVMYLVFKGTGRMTTVVIEPAGTNGNIKFYLTSDQTSTGVIGDLVNIPGGSISWIVD